MCAQSDRPVNEKGGTTMNCTIANPGQKTKRLRRGACAPALLARAGPGSLRLHCQRQLRRQQHLQLQTLAAAQRSPAGAKNHHIRPSKIQTRAICTSTLLLETASFSAKSMKQSLASSGSTPGWAVLTCKLLLPPSRAHAPLALQPALRHPTPALPALRTPAGPSTAATWTRWGLNLQDASAHTTAHAAAHSEVSAVS
jgi:hypothetical protein